VTAAGWDGFAGALATALAGLPAGALVVVTERDAGAAARYAQFSQTATELTAEVVEGGRLPAERQASEAGEAAIAAAGWRPPEPGAGRENWWRRLPWPATADGYRQLAGAVVAALRDGYGVAGPDALGYRAWIRDTGADLDLPLPVPAVR
jgi:type III secretion system-like peptide-binding chaperone